MGRRCYRFFLTFLVGKKADNLAQLACIANVSIIKIHITAIFTA